MPKHVETRICCDCGTLYGRTLRKVAEHYRKAVAKHPYFCDSVIDHFNGGPQTALAAKAMQEEHAANRAFVRFEADCEMLTPETLLGCKFAGALEAYARGDTAAAVDECYDCIAVLLRMIDVLEGWQPLGKPKEGQEARNEGAH